MAECEPRVSAEDVAAFERDGAVCLRGALSSAWMARIADALEDVLAAPSERSKFADPERRGFFQDADNWRRIPALGEIVWHSPAARLAAGLLRSRRINFLQDHILVKEPNTERPTIWHQDQPYSPIDGRDFLTMWIAVDAVPEERSLRFVRGSHRGGRWYRPRHFSTGQQREGDDPRWSPLPDVDAEPERYPQITWAVEPGDVVAFHGLTLHGAPGNLSAGTRRRVLSLRWTGDDARFAPRSGPMSPHPPAGMGLAAGGPIDCPAFPRVLGA
ncbi:phytanoyl-CoA dioxygenase family protein [Zavarzinia sp.]|uniref:phytanoyl-CoA dioxygenase family protein n=1 Tax=Zavarzinia sp. TaxID=2027920 RepID=UPI003562B5BA